MINPHNIINIIVIFNIIYHRFIAFINHIFVGQWRRSCVAERIVQNYDYTDPNKPNPRDCRFEVTMPIYVNSIMCEYICYNAEAKFPNIYQMYCTHNFAHIRFNKLTTLTSNYDYTSSILVIGL